jgi:peptidoglycan-associated lipoprotein
MSAFVHVLKLPKTLAGVCAVLMLAGACSSTPEPEIAASGTGAAVIPAGPVPGSTEDFASSVPDRVFFALDRHDLDEADRQVLQRQAAWLAQYPSVMITVEGHADERGSREYNLDLGARRANEVKAFLTQQGVDGQRITTVSYGKERPVDPRSSEEAWRLNRRSVTVLNESPGY